MPDKAHAANAKARATQQANKGNISQSTKNAIHAKANKILQNSLGGPEGYLRYLQIQALEDTKAGLIYVPTEAGLPITEARRLDGQQPAK